MKKYSVDTPDPLMVSEPTAEHMISYARKGIDMSFVSNMMERLSLSLKDIADILHVSLRTLQRYNTSTKLDTDASSKLLYLSKLEVTGLRVFGSHMAFTSWLKSPVMALGGHTPLSYLDTPFGFELVEQTLGRIEHGIFA
jgi:putative toxin-antitoxin system antitoxin component (TIGR02293 family)